MAQRAPLLSLLLLGTLLFLATRVDAGDAREQATTAPPELGQVEWLRDYEQASARAKAEGKPIFLLFQEVPGCSTCVNFGEQVLSNPLLREAIEDEFVPVAILNNVGGQDRRVLERFREPAWNNPVVRFVDASGRDLIPRKDRIWQPAQVAERMTKALARAGQTSPTYLTALHNEMAPARIERATLAMPCYWVGEACLGSVPGLLSSRTGDLGGREVVEVRYDASRLSYAELVQQARRKGCADGVFAHNESQFEVAQAIYGKQAKLAPGVAREASARNQKFHLKRFPELAALDLTPAQATRLNYYAWKEKNPSPVLSPRQQAMLQK